MAREFQDDLASVNAAKLRREGVIKPGAASALVSFGEGADALRREVKLWHRVWSHGRGLSLFLCPRCGGKAKILRLHDGRWQCRKCLLRQKIQFRIAYGTPVERAEAREKRIEKLRAQVAASSLRARPSGGRGVEGRRSLAMSLRRSLIRQRENMLEEVEKWRGPPGR
jgi:ribosomal protein L37AE/L43A